MSRYLRVLLGVVLTVLNLGPFTKEQSLLASLLLVCVLVFGSHANFDFPLKYKKEADQLEKVEPYRDKLCIVVSDLGDNYRIIPSYRQLSSFKNVVFMQVDTLDDLDMYGLTDLDEAVVYIQNDFAYVKEVCKTIIKSNEKMEEFEKLFSSQYMEVYHIW